MRERLIDGLLHGDRGSWGALAALWALTTLLVLIHRPVAPTASRRGGFALALLAIATATSLAGLPLSAALAVPRVQWKAVDAPDLVPSTPSTTWRRLLGPMVVMPGPEPEIGVPSIDASNRWVLVGLFSGAPIPGLPPAEASPAAPGGERLCSNDTECRAWPVAWPDPKKPTPQSELTWSRRAPPTWQRPLAFDVETGLYLTRIETSSGQGPHIEIIGRGNTDPRMEGPHVVLHARTVSAGRLRAVRVAAVPDTKQKGQYVFQVHRATTSFTAAPRVFAWVARPLLALTAFALPLGVTALLIARRRQNLDRALPWIEALGAFAAGLAAAAPALVAVANLWGSR